MEQNISWPNERTESSSNARAHEPAISFSRIQVEQWIRHRNKRKNFLYRQVHNLFEYIIAVQVSSIGVLIIYCLTYGKENYKWLLAYACSVWAAFYIIREIRLAINLKKISEYSKKKHTISTIVKNALLILVHIEIGLYFAMGYFSDMYSIIVPLFLALFMPFITYTKSLNHCFSFLRIMKFMIAVFRGLLVLLLMLYYTKKVKISPTIVYIPVWIALFVSILSALFCITLILISACTSIKERHFREERI